MLHIKLAGFIFTIDNQFSYMEKLCQDYIVDTPGEKIWITKKDILRENRDGGKWPEAYLESLAFYRKICERLLEKDILLFHCTALELEGKAYLFTGPSGIGKSTHAKLWRKYFGNKVVMINDDKPLLSIRKEGVIVYGTPYGGKEGLQTNTSTHVSGIVVLHQGLKNTIWRMTEKEAYPFLLNQTYRRNDRDGMIKTMELVRMLSKLPIYFMECTVSMEAVELANRCLTNNF